MKYRYVKIYLIMKIK